MKHILVILLLGFVSMQAQDREPNAWDFVWGYDSRPRIFHPDSVMQKSVITGFQWSGSLQMNNALLNNACAGGRLDSVPEGSRKYKLQFIFQPTWKHRSGGHVGAWAAPYMQYEPTLPITNDNKGTILRPQDPSDPVFGFLYRRGSISDDPNNENYSRLVLTKAAKPTYGGDIVLDSIWPNPQFNSKNLHDITGQTDAYTGKIWYLTINLRRLNPAEETIKDDSVVLSIKKPYTKGDGSKGFIRFNKLPINHEDSVIQLNYFEDRGYAQKMQNIDPTINEIKITRRMIPTSPKEYQNITISAEFKTVFNEDSIREKYNPGFTQDGNKDTFKITDFDIQVKYFGKLDIAIDYIRIEEIRAHDMVRGKMDTIMPVKEGEVGSYILYPDPDYPNDPSPVNEIQRVIQTSLDVMKVRAHDWNDAIPFRFYYQDTESNAFYWWGPLRYLNRATNGMYITRDNYQYPDLYNYYTKSPNRWVGLTFGSHDGQMPAPYSRNGNLDWKTYGLKYGYFQHFYSHNFPDTLNSQYETSAGAVSLWADDHHYFNHILDSNDCLQPRWEKAIYDLYFNKNMRNDRLIYSNGHWWVNHLFYAMGLDEDSLHMMNGYYRAKTGEENRMITNSVLLKGCKGFTYDGDQNYRFPDFRVGQMGLGDYNMLNDTNNLYSDWVGTDFVDSVHNTWNAFYYVEPDTLAKYMQIPRNRTYIGTKSIRTELFKMHSFIRAMDTTLINLRLAALMCKGYREWYSQDSLRFGSDTLFKRFINFSDIQTGPVGRLKMICQPEGGPVPVKYYEPWDSSFIDISLLNHTNDSLLTGNIFYVGIQNRRTDPLIYMPDTLDKAAPYDSVDTYMKFYSTAEIDERARFGGNTIMGTYHDAAWWKDKYWKRQGSREVVFTFNYKPIDSIEYCLLRVQDMGAGSSLETDTSAWWFREPFRNRIDTIIGQDRSIVLKLLPGEGRFLKVEVLHPGITEGFLAHSNQIKIIAYPIGFSNDTLRYHLVYFKKRPGTDINTVYYRRSLPIRKDITTENIIWEPERMMSGKVRIFDTSINDSLRCDYPSIVLRKDGSILKAYVVYSCKSVEFPWDSYIVENQIQFNKDNYVNLPTDTIGRVISGYRGLNRKEWGNPVINASNGGNYYAWSDSVGRYPNLSQIVAAWKAPGSTTFSSSNKDSISYQQWSARIGLDTFKHPSLNVYSNIDKGENNCALVYQGHLNHLPPILPGSWQIFYTRLQRTPYGLRHFVPGKFVNYRKMVDTCFGLALLTDFQINDQIDNTYPVVIRNLNDYDFFTSDSTINRHDRIYWQNKDFTYGNGLESIYLRSILLADSANLSMKWSTSRASRLSKSGKWLQQPVVTNSVILNDNGEIAGEELVLNFTSSPIGQAPSTNSEIWQYPHSYLSFLTNNDLLSEYPVSQRINSGQYPHLSMSNTNLDNIFGAWKGRRVYEFSSSNPPKIMSSARYFYKMISGNEEMGDALIGFTNDSTSYFINLPTVDGNNLTMHLPYIKRDGGQYDDFYEQFETDTLYSDWFQVNDEAHLEFKCQGLDTARISIKMHQESSANYWTLTLPNATPGNYGILRQYTLFNGNGFNYRLEFTKRDTTAYYSERLILDGLPVLDTMRKIAKTGENIIYLHEQPVKESNNIYISLYPNPADKVIYATAYIPQSNVYGRNKSNTNLILKVYSNAGTELFRQEVKPGETISITTDKLSQGAYFIRAEEKVNSWDNPLLPVMKSFIIER